MRKTFFLIGCLVCALFVYAQPKYEVYATSGSVSLKHYDNSIVDIVAPRISLNIKDVLILGNNASVKILEKTSGRVYYSDVKGSYTVQQRIEKATRSANKTFQNLNKELIKAAKKDEKTNNGYVSFAASSRGMPQDADFADSLYSFLLYSIEHVSEISSKVLRIEKISTEDGGFYYKLSNQGDKILYFNAVAIDGNQMGVCFDFQIKNIGLLPIMPSESVNLESYPLYCEGSIVFFGCEIPFAISRLEEVIKEKDSTFLEIHKLPKTEIVIVN